MAGTEAPASADDAAAAAALAERRAAIDEKLAATEQARQEAVSERQGDLSTWKSCVTRNSAWFETLCRDYPAGGSAASGR